MLQCEHVCIGTGQTSLLNLCPKATASNELNFDEDFERCCKLALDKDTTFQMIMITLAVAHHHGCTKIS